MRALPPRARPGPLLDSHSDYRVGVFVVRRAEPDEVEAAIEVWKVANATRNLPQHAHRLKLWAGADGAVLFVADNGAEMVGMALSMVGRANDGAGEVIQGLRHLSGVCVRPDRQGHRVGSELLDAILRHAGEEGCDQITLWTHQSNIIAQRLFAAHGFKPTGRTMPDEAGALMVHLAVPLTPGFALVQPGQ